MYVNFREKIPKIGFYRPKRKSVVRYKINAILAHFEKKVQITSIKVIRVFFLLVIFSQNMLNCIYFIFNHQYLFGHKKSNFVIFFTKIYIHV